MSSNFHDAAFLRLPEELLTHIVEQFLEATLPPTLQDLKRIRLVHPCLGHLKRIKSELFSTISLRPDPRRLGARDIIKSFAPHVIHVVFEPVSLRRSTCQALNFSVMKARQQYEHDVFHMLRTGGAAEALGSMLCLLPNVHSVTVTETKVSSDKDALVPSGDSLLDLAVQSIASANIHIKRFFIGHHPDHDFDWTRRLPYWKDLRLEDIQTLHFHPGTDTREEILWQYRPDPFGQTPPPIVAGLEPDITLNHMLTRCSSTLEELSCRCHTLIMVQSWRLRQGPKLSLLRKLEISDGLVDAPFLAEWVPTCINLTYLTLTRLHPSAGDRMPNWRPIFDAIRAHRNRMTIALMEVDIWAGLR